MKLDPVHKGNGINDEMTVQMVFLIQMGSDQHLIFLAPKLPCQPDRDFMGNLRSGFTGSKALIAVIGHRAVLLAEAFLYRQHFFPCSGGQTVDAGDKVLQEYSILILQPRLFLIGGIRDHVR